MQVALYPDLAIEHWKSMDLYAQQLASWLPKVSQGCQIRLAGVKPSQWIDRSLRLPYLHRALNDRFYSRYVVYSRSAAAWQGDVNHVLDHSYGHLLRVLDPQRTIVTVHDLYPLHVIDQSVPTPRQQGRKVLLQWVMKHALRAQQLITPSDFTKQELIRLTDYPAERVSVIHLGVDEGFFQPVNEEAQRRYRASLDLPDQATLLLHVGSCDARKNIPMLLRGLEMLVRQVGTDLHLLQIGGQFTEDHIRQIERANLTARIRQCSLVSVHELMCAYQAADLLLLPSTYEGFGLTALEAMASGTPVVGSALGALREVAGEAGVWIDPNSEQQLVEAVMQVLRDASLRARLVQSGRARAAQLTWQETARKTWAVYQQVYAGRL